MPQDRTTGAAGRDYGLRTAKGVARLLGLELARPGSNEVEWRGRRAVIKSCRPGTSSFGVTRAMLPRLASILVALEDEHGAVQVWDLPTAAFRAVMYDSRSHAAAGGRVKMVARSYVLQEGRPVARFERAQVEAAALT